VVAGGGAGCDVSFFFFFFFFFFSVQLRGRRAGTRRDFIYLYLYHVRGRCLQAAICSGEGGGRGAGTLLAGWLAGWLAAFEMRPTRPAARPAVGRPTGAYVVCIPYVQFVRARSCVAEGGLFLERTSPIPSLRELIFFPTLTSERQ